jgi:hypothetical protein
MPDVFSPIKEAQRATGTDGKNLAENLASQGGKQKTTMDFRGHTRGNGVDCCRSESVAAIYQSLRL